VHWLTFQAVLWRIDSKEIKAATAVDRTQFHIVYTIFMGDYVIWQSAIVCSFTAPISGIWMNPSCSKCRVLSAKCNGRKQTPRYDTTDREYIIYIYILICTHYLSVWSPKVRQCNRNLLCADRLGLINAMQRLWYFLSGPKGKVCGVTMSIRTKIY